MILQLPRDLPRTARPRALAGRREWYRIEAKAEEEADVFIYDEIGWWGLTAADFVRDLQAIKTAKINLHLNTPGGDLFDGIAIHNALRRHSATVHVVVDSLAASIGSVIAMAGDSVTMARHSTLMIHDPYTIALGDAAEMRKTAEVLDQLGDAIADVYAERAGGSVHEWRDRMMAESWYSDREAVAAGLADQVEGDAAVENHFDLSAFKHPPANLLGVAARADERPEPTKREVERALREAGLSRAQAKAFVAAAWEKLEPEAETREVSDLLALRDALKTLIG